LVLSNFFLASCSTVSPSHVEDKSPSFSSSGKADSGILAVAPGDAGFFVDAYLIERYNALIDRYGSDPLFQPALKKNEGITFDKKSGQIIMSKRAMENFLLMNAWRKQGKEPRGWFDKLKEAL
jgi:hypothetical protein